MVATGISLWPAERPGCGALGRRGRRSHEGSITLRGRDHELTLAGVTRPAVGTRMHAGDPLAEMRRGSGPN